MTTKRVYILGSVHFSSDGLLYMVNGKENILNAVKCQLK